MLKESSIGTGTEIQISQFFFKWIALTMNTSHPYPVKTHFQSSEYHHRNLSSSREDLHKQSNCASKDEDLTASLTLR